jgi:CRP-like cAMP-binding protein
MKTKPTSINILFSKPLAGVEKHFTKGDFLFRQNETVNTFYIVLKGRVKLTRNTIDGNPVVLNVATANETIAEASLFSDNYHCNAIVDCTSTLYVLSKKHLMEFLTKDASLTLQIMELFSLQIRALRKLLEIKNIRSANERVYRYFEFNATNNQVILNISLKDIAYKLGLAHETFYRSIKHLEKTGKITKSKTIITLL